MDGDAAKTRFLSAIGHDMRQPLHALMLYLAALDRRVHDDEARAVLGKAERAAQSLAAMFDMLLDLARIDANKFKPDVAEVPLQDVFDQVATQSPGVAVEATALHVRSDPVLLERIVRNIASNALKHGGGNAHLSARARDAVVEISVSDSGPGIAAEDHNRIFEEFVRLEGAPADGLGLGLTITRGLADLLGHTIEVRSAPGQGAIFVVRAPRA